MKKILSVLLSITMLLSITAGIDLTAGANTKDTATTLSFSDQYSGDLYLTSTATELWYKVVIPSDGKLTIKLMSYSGNKAMDFYNSDLSTTITYDHYMGGSGSESSPVTDTMELNLSSGTYYSRISKGYEGKFKLYANFTSYNVTDDGSMGYYDSYNSPVSLSSGYQITAALTETDTEDWYKITVPSDGNYLFKLTSYSGNKAMDFYNSDLSTTITYNHYMGGGGSESSPVTDTKNITLSAGTYYIKVSTGYKGLYYFYWAALTPDNCSHDFSTSTVSPTYLAQGYTLHTCSICGYSYMSDYTAKLKVTKQTVSSVKKGKKKITVTCYKSGVDGIQIQYSTSKKFPSGSKTKTVSTTKTSKTIKKLKSKKKYYVRVRGYKLVDGKKVYSSWSSVKSVKTK